MQILFIRTTAFLFLLFAGTVHAQQPVAAKSWSLEECIDYALKNNIQVKQSELNTGLNKVNLLQSQGNLLPSINGNASHSYNIGRTIDRFTNQFADAQVLSQNLYVSAEISLFSGFQNINTIKQNRYEYLASKYDVDKMKNDVSLNVATAYLQALYAMDALTNARNQTGITASQVSRTKQLVDAGASAKGTLLDMQAQLAAEEVAVTDAQNQLDIALLSLSQLLNLPSSEGFSIVKPDLSTINESLLTSTPAAIYTTAIRNLPEVKSAEYNLKSAEKGIDVAWGGLSPRLSFSASYGTGYSGASQRVLTLPQFTNYTPNGDITSSGDTVFSPAFTDPTFEKIPFTDQYRDNVNKSFGFYLQVPIFNKLQTKTSIDRAKIQKMSAELTIESTKLQIQKNVQQAYADANAGLKKYASSMKALEAMEESFKYSEQKFNVGMVNTTDYNTAKNKMAKAQSDLLQAKYDYVFKAKVLDFYQGRPLKF
ncbi:MAG TPA: TolC family protein [Bacteroidia bacterium]|jgi:outer membrane protein